MDAAILFETGAPLVIARDIEVPPPSYGQVFVELSYSGICHSQLMEVEGKRGPDPYLPHLLGHEGVGRVLAIGEGVTKVKIGDSVILGWIRGKGIEAQPPKYNWQGHVLNAGRVTTFNTHALISENRCYVKPQNIPEDIAVLFGCALPTGAGIVLNEINPEPGTSAVVFGLGGIGLIALMTLKAAGCESIFAVDVSKEKLDLALELGATQVINASTSNPVTEIQTLTKGQGVDYAIDAAGRAKTIEQAFASIRKFGGLCIFASHPPAGENINLDPHELISGKQIRGSWGGAVNPERDIPRFAELYEKGELLLNQLIRNRYSLDEVDHAIGEIKNKTAYRPILTY